MATKKIEMEYDLRQMNNEKSEGHMKWYPHAVRRTTLSLKGLSDHIRGHGSIYTDDVITGVLSKFSTCLVELVQQGVGVKLDGLGTFFPTLEATGASTPIGYNIDAKLVGVHIRFTPEGVGDSNITSRAMKDKVCMKQRMLFDANGVPKKIKNGELVDYGTDDDDDDQEG